MTRSLLALIMIINLTLTTQNYIQGTPFLPAFSSNSNIKQDDSQTLFHSESADKSLGTDTNYSDIIIYKTMANHLSNIFVSDKLNYQPLPNLVTDKDSLFFIDRRIELFNIIQWLSQKYPAKTELKFSYINDVNNYFSKYRSHEAVLSLNKLISFGFTFDAPVSFFLHVNQGLDSIYAGLSKDIIQRAGGKENLKYFLGIIKSFVKESRFDDFFNSHIPYYKNLIMGINHKYPTNNIIRQVESFYNMKLPTCKIILSTLTKGGFGPKVKGSDGRTIYVTVSSPRKLSDDNRLIYFEKESTLRALLWHELSHPIVNPLVDKYWNKLSKFTRLINAMKKTAPAWYKDDKVIYYENVVRAVTIKMSYINFGKEREDKNSGTQTKWGFPYAGIFAQFLSADETKNFEDRFNILIQELSKINNSIN